MSQSIRGKTAIVTGAGSGINLAFAQQLLAGGCNIVIADLALRPEAQELVNAHSATSSTGQGRAVFQKTDVTNWSHLERMFNTAEVEFGEVDIVCPGAGVYEPVCISSTRHRTEIVVADLDYSPSVAFGTLQDRRKVGIR
jgi:NAD(P)-dependent dehydrogenase (short-subunit alcohol dehydrogenase family)